MTYKVIGTAHGDTFNEGGFAERVHAEAYASDVIDGDVDSTVEIIPEPAPSPRDVLTRANDDGRIGGRRIA